MRLHALVAARMLHVNGGGGQTRRSRADVEIQHVPRRDDLFYPVLDERLEIGIMELLLLVRQLLERFEHRLQLRIVQVIAHFDEALP